MNLKIIISGLLLIWVISACQPQVETIASSDTVKPEDVPTVDPANEALYTAQQNYNKYCAHCHGWAGDGQPQSTITNAEELGYHTVPPHNQSGHTWQHPDQVLFEVIKYGVQAPTNLYPMSPYAENLTDDEIFGVITYLKQWWTDEQRQHQDNLTSQFEENNPYWEDDNLDEVQS